MVIRLHTVPHYFMLFSLTKKKINVTKRLSSFFDTEYKTLPLQFQGTRMHNMLPLHKTMHPRRCKQMQVPEKKLARSNKESHSIILLLPNSFGGTMVAVEDHVYFGQRLLVARVHPFLWRCTKKNKSKMKIKDMLFSFTIYLFNHLCTDG